MSATCCRPQVEHRCYHPGREGDSSADPPDAKANLILNAQAETCFQPAGDQYFSWDAKPSSGKVTRRPSHTVLIMEFFRAVSLHLKLALDLSSTFAITVVYSAACLFAAFAFAGSVSAGTVWSARKAWHVCPFHETDANRVPHALLSSRGPLLSGSPRPRLRPPSARAQGPVCGCHLPRALSVAVTRPGPSSARQSRVSRRCLCGRSVCTSQSHPKSCSSHTSLPLPLPPTTPTPHPADRTGPGRSLASPFRRRASRKLASWKAVSH